MHILRLVTVIVLAFSLASANEKKKTTKKHHWLRFKPLHRQTAPNLIVETREGPVRGRTRISADRNILYYAFHGIPYAEPPVDDLRFRSPVPARNRTRGIWDATYERDVCFQSPSQANMSEDCLYINVYTAQLPSSSDAVLLPVMVWIYGGAFLTGDGNYGTYGPDFFINDNVIVVTFNYRLGPFGFLSTGDLAAPGNYGLKDQILALRWVQNNIASFGGNPRNVTIFGESAGAASVSYLLQTNLTQGLYQRAIMQSGNSLCLWALSRTASLHARRLQIDVPFDNSENYVNRLRRLSAADLQARSNIVMAGILAINPLNGLVLAPVVEPEHEDAVFTSRSYELLNGSMVNRVPVLMGFNSEEGNGFSEIVRLLKLYLVTFDAIPERLIPVDLNVDITSRNIVGREIRDHYNSNNGTFTGDTSNFIHFVSDNEFVRPIRQYVRLFSRLARVYYYELSYEGPLGNQNRNGQRGVGHAEDLNYLFITTPRPQNLTASDNTTRYRMVRMWTNFAKTGNPTPIRDPLLQNVTWGTASTSRNLTYLDIGQNLVIKSNPQPNDMDFWDFIYSTYGNPPYDTYK